MRKTLLLTVCILLGGAAAAFARSTTTVVALDQSCDKFDVTISKGKVVASDAPSCAGTFGAGLVGKRDGFITLGMQDPSQPGVQFVLQLSYPLVSGGTFSLYQTIDGLHLQDMQDGNYSVEAAARVDPTSQKPRKSLFRN